MPVRKILNVIPALLILAVAFWYANNFPLGRENQRVVGFDGSPPIYITLQRDQGLRQTFATPTHDLRNIDVFSPEKAFNGRHMTLVVENNEEKEVARTSTVKVSYRDNDMRLSFQLPSINKHLGEKMSFTVYLVQGDPISVIARTENPYKTGRLFLDNAEQENKDIVFNTTGATDTPIAIHYGLTGALLFTLGFIVISLWPIKYGISRWVAAAILIAVTIPIVLHGFIIDTAKLGISDWDYYFSLHHVLRKTIIDYNQFPLWNPWICGGTAALADPEFSVLTPTFALELLFGVPLGLRLAIFFSTIIGSWGVLALAKRLRLSVEAALIAAVIAFLGTVNLLEVVEGHVNIFAAMWLPWIFWSWLAAYRISTHYSLLTTYALLLSLFLGLTFLQGGIYLLMYTIIAFIFLIIVVERRKQAVLITATSGLMAIGLVALKLIPVLYWLRHFPDKAYATSAFTMPWLHEIFFGRHLHGVDIITNQNSGWHEYGAYIGPFAFALFLLGCLNWRRNRLVGALMVGTIFAILFSTLGPILKPIFDVAPFLPRSTVSRLIIYAILPMSLLAGLGLENVRKKFPMSFAFMYGLLVLMVIDLFTPSAQLSTQAFALPAVTSPPSYAPSPIAFTEKMVNDTWLDRILYTRSYASVQRGYGTLNYCSVLGPEPAVTLADDGLKPPYISTPSNQGQSKPVAWSPNNAVVETEAIERAEVVLNTNWAPGWHVNGNNAREIGNRVGTHVDSGTHTLHFAFKPEGLLAGIIVSIMSLIFWLSLLAYSVWKNTSSKSHS